MTNSYPLFDRLFITRQHARCSPVSKNHRFLFDAVEDDIRARLSFLKDKPQSFLIHGRRFFDGAGTEFPQHARFKLTPDDEIEFFPPCHSDKSQNLPEKYDCIISLFSLHAVNNVPKALSNMRSLLSDKGIFVACVFGGQTLSILKQSLAAAELELRGTAPTRIYPFAEAPAWAGQLQMAGFALPVADGETITVHYRSLNALLNDIRKMGESNGMTARPRSPLTHAIIAHAEEIYKDLTQDKDELLPANFDLVYLQGFKS